MLKERATLTVCSNCQSTTRSGCTCPWKVTVRYSTAIVFARYMARATRGNFRFDLELTAHAWTEKGAEKRLRRCIRRYEARQARRDTVREFTIEGGKA